MLHQLILESIVTLTILKTTVSKNQCSAYNVSVNQTATVSGFARNSFAKIIMITMMMITMMMMMMMMMMTMTMTMTMMIGFGSGVQTLP